MEYIIDDEDSQVMLYKHYYKGSRRLYRSLMKDTEWNYYKSPYQGGKYNVPRGMICLADKGIKEYRYNNIRIPAINWDKTTIESYIKVRKIRDKIQRKLDIEFDSCLLNYYKDGNDYVAYHGDKEALGEDNAVVTVSLGQTRKFYLKSNTTKEVTKVFLETGDMVLMRGDTQKDYQHTIPKETTIKEGRISLTFRQIKK